MALEIRLLGTTEAFRDGHRIDLPGDRLRTLLAYLALAAGTSRSFAGIVDALWPANEGEMPADPRSTVHTYASRIRSALGHDAVVARHGGYALEVAPFDVDVSRFESLMRSASDPGCSIARRVELLSEGLALWRGPALDGVNNRDWARPDAVRLEELRATAEDDRAEAMLTLGDASTAMPLLSAAASSRPLRERTHVLLMTALHQGGRQAEALRVFQDYRHRLGTDLGLEAGDAITALERSIASGERPAPALACGTGAVSGYVLHERIGEGSFAVVYRGRQPSVERDVAIKVIRAELANRPEFVRRFEAEAHMVANLEHPHIVPLYDFWRVPGSACLVMRLFPAGTLEQRIAAGPMQLHDVVRMVGQVGAALATAHAAGVVHRDVKPANICLDTQGNFFLGDFGIAHDVISSTAPTDTLSLGSPHYASPEQLRREPVGPAADVHGLAIIVFEALSGRLPFADSHSQAELVHHQLNDPLPSLQLALPAGPHAAVARLESVLARATAKDPTQRQASVADFVVDFTDAAGGSEAPKAAQRRISRRLVDDVLRNPYKGLRAFDEGDVADFFGRARLVDRFIDRLRGSDVSGRMLTVIGPSGSGKSSVVRAGLLPRLRSGAIGGSASWYISTMVPGLHPFEELESALARIAITPVGGTAEAMASERRGISRGVRRFLPDDGQLVLVIDQFEELFMLCADPHERELFIAGLIEALTEPRSRLRVVCTLRADFYDRPLRHPELAKLVEGSTVAVTPLAADELEAAITEPAHRAGVEFEPGLVAHIVADVVDQPGALPLLQYALTELFDRQEQGVLTLAAYEAFGGLTGALARRGEDLYTTESEREREATRRLFTRLVSLGEATEDTRRRVRRSELGGDADTQAMIDRFGEARLLSFDRDPTTREQTVEVAHEALLREWPRLRAWLDDDRDGLRLQRHITTSASAWEARARDDSELYHGARLETATHWVDEHPGELNDTERAFIDASRDQHRSIEAARVRSARRLRRAVVAMAAIAIIALVAGGIAWRQQRAATSSRRAAAAAAREANDQRDAATASATDAEQQRLISDQQRLLAQAASRDADTQRESAVATAYAAETARMAAIAPRLAKSDPTLGMLLAAEADQRGRDPATLGALQDVLAADTTLGYIRPGPANYIVQQVGFDAAGDIVTFGGIPAGNTYDEQIIIWDAHTHVKIRSIPNPRTSIPQGPEVVSISGNEAAWIDTNNDVWTADLTTGEIMPQGGAADAVGLAIDAVSHQLVVVTSTGEVQAFDDGQNSPRWTAGGDLAVPGTKAYVVFNQAGTKVYISRTLGVRVFEMTSGNEFPGVSYPTGGAPQYIAPLASDDSKVIIGSPDKAVLANLNAGTTTDVPPAVKSSDSYNFIATGGDRYAAIDFNGSVTISDATNATLVGPIELNSGRTWAAAVSPDGRTMVVGGDIGAEIIALDASTLMRATLPIPSDFKHFVAISDRLTYASNTTTDPKDFQVHTGSYWDCEQQCAQSTMIPDGPWDEPYTQVNGWIPVLEFSPSKLPSDPWHETWNIFDERGLLHASGPAPAMTYTIPGAVFVPKSGTWIAFVSYDGQLLHPTLEVRSLPDWGLLHSETLQPFDEVRFVGPAEPAKLLVVHTLTGAVADLLDTKSWQTTPLPLGFDEVAAGVYSTDGNLLYTASASGNVAIRDASTLDVRTTLSGAVPSTNANGGAAIAITDDSRFLLTAVDGQARLWDLATDEPIGDPLGEPVDLGNSSPVYPQVVGGATLKYVTANNGLVQVWHFDLDQYRNMACQLAGRNMSQEEWKRYGPANAPYHATCPQWPDG